MTEDKQLSLQTVIWRVGLVLLITVPIWYIVSFLYELFPSDEYSRTEHFITALITSLLTFCLIEIVRRKSGLSWKQLGMGSIRTNLSTFFTGFLLWFIPALLGFVLCLSFGWVEIEVHTHWGSLIGSILILMITVFFMEAFPEELVFREFVFRHLNTQFSQWATVIIQGLLFTFFAFLIGAMNSPVQIQFIPIFGLLLGYMRVLSGNVWLTMGFHTAIMTFMQIMGPAHGHVSVDNFIMLQFIAFILLPSAFGTAALHFLYPEPRWKEKKPLPKDA